MFRKKLFVLLIFVICFFAATTGTSQNKKCDTIDAYFKEIPSAKGFDNLAYQLLDLEDYESAVYILTQKSLYFPDHEVELTKEMIEETVDMLDVSVPCNCDVLKKPVWKSSNGPIGADATSFYLDKKGSYWLGTGSSGGMYYSSNKGKSWEERNKGIGPWHIVNIMSQNDTLFIKVNQFSNQKNGQVRFYYWEKLNSSWVYVPADLSWSGRETPSYGTRLYEKFDALEEAEYKTWETSSKLNYKRTPGAKYSFRDADYYFERGVDPSGVMPDYYAGRQVRRVFGYKEEEKAFADLNKGFPRDMVALSAGNLFDLGKGNQILLSKSGPYLVKKEKSIKPMSVQGMVATDVRQMVTNSEGIIYGLVNEADIWKYEKGNWSCVFNAYEKQLERDNPISLKGYDTQQLSMQKDESILFVFCGDIWRLDPDGNSYEIKIDNQTLKTSSENTHIYYSTVCEDEDGTFFLTAYLEYSENNPSIYSSNERILERERALLKWSNNKLELVEVLDMYSEPWLFVDRTGKVWLKDGVSMKSVGSKAKEVDKLDVNYNRIWKASLALKPNGDFAFVSDQKIMLWSAKESVWSEVADLKNLYSVSCIGFDDKGDLYAGTGKQYSTGCGGDGFYGADNGVFKWEKDHWEPILNGVNTWVFSLAPEKEFGLAVGTSGSGVQLLKTK